MKIWTDEERQLAIGLYCQLPFGRLHKTNPIIVRVAEEMGRTPSSLAMKTVNFASLDPLFLQSGRKGLSNVSAADRAAWAAFEANRAQSVDRVEALLEAAGVADRLAPVPPSGPTETLRSVRQRRGQRFFRTGVLASYRSTCCISGLRDARLLVASHIVPWSHDEEARLDLRNGLCLSSLHDRLFDAGIITVAPDHRVCVSLAFRERHVDAFAYAVIHPLHGYAVSLPEKFAPLDSYLRFHNEHIFEGRDAGVSL